MPVIPHILKLDAGGLPVEWIEWQQAVSLYFTDKIAWEAGTEKIRYVAGGLERRVCAASWRSIRLSPCGTAHTVLHETWFPPSRVVSYSIATADCVCIAARA